MSWTNYPLGSGNLNTTANVAPGILGMPAYLANQMPVSGHNLNIPSSFPSTPMGMNYAHYSSSHMQNQTTHITNNPVSGKMSGSYNRDSGKSCGALKSESQEISSSGQRFRASSDKYLDSKLKPGLNMKVMSNNHYWCTVCQVSVGSSIADYLYHTGDFAHGRAVFKKFIPDSDTHVDPSSEILYCEICDIRVIHVGSYMQHCMGKKHKTKMLEHRQKAEKARKANERTIPTIEGRRQSKDAIKMNTPNNSSKEIQKFDYAHGMQESQRANHGHHDSDLREHELRQGSDLLPPNQNLGLSHFTQSNAETFPMPNMFGSSNIGQRDQNTGLVQSMTSPQRNANIVTGSGFEFNASKTYDEKQRPFSLTGPSNPHYSVGSVSLNAQNLQTNQGRDFQQTKSGLSTFSGNQGTGYGYSLNDPTSGQSSSIIPQNDFFGNQTANQQFGTQSVASISMSSPSESYGGMISSGFQPMNAGQNLSHSLMHAMQNLPSKTTFDAAISSQRFNYSERTGLHDTNITRNQQGQVANYDTAQQQGIFRNGPFSENKGSFSRSLDAFDESQAPNSESRFNAYDISKREPLGADEQSYASRADSFLDGVCTSDISDSLTIEKLLREKKELEEQQAKLLKIVRQKSDGQHDRRSDHGTFRATSHSEPYNRDRFTDRENVEQIPFREGTGDQSTGFHRKRMSRSPNSLSRRRDCDTTLDDEDNYWDHKTGVWRQYGEQLRSHSTEHVKDVKKDFRIARNDEDYWNTETGVWRHHSPNEPNNRDNENRKRKRDDIRGNVHTKQQAGDSGRLDNISDRNREDRRDRAPGVKENQARKAQSPVSYKQDTKSSDSHNLDRPQETIDRLGGHDRYLNKDTKERHDYNRLHFEISFYDEWARYREDWDRHCAEGDWLREEWERYHDEWDRHPEEWGRHPQVWEARCAEWKRAHAEWERRHDEWDRSYEEVERQDWKRDEDLQSRHNEWVSHREQWRSRRQKWEGNLSGTRGRDEDLDSHQTNVVRRDADEDFGEASRAAASLKRTPKSQSKRYDGTKQTDFGKAQKVHSIRQGSSREDFGEAEKLHSTKRESHRRSRDGKLGTVQQVSHYENKGSQYRRKDQNPEKTLCRDSKERNQAQGTASRNEIREEEHLQVNTAAMGLAPEAVENLRRMGFEGDPMEFVNLVAQMANGVAIDSLGHGCHPDELHQLANITQSLTTMIVPQNIHTGPMPSGLDPSGPILNEIMHILQRLDPAVVQRIAAGDPVALQILQQHLDPQFFDMLLALRPKMQAVPGDSTQAMPALMNMELASVTRASHAEVDNRNRDNAQNRQRGNRAERRQRTHRR